MKSDTIFDKSRWDGSQQKRTEWNGTDYWKCEMEKKEIHSKIMKIANYRSNQIKNKNITRQGSVAQSSKARMPGNIWLSIQETAVTKNGRNKQMTDKQTRDRQTMGVNWRV